MSTLDTDVSCSIKEHLADHPDYKNWAKIITKLCVDSVLHARKGGRAIVILPNKEMMAEFGKLISGSSPDGAKKFVQHLRALTIDIEKSEASFATPADIAKSKDSLNARSGGKYKMDESTTTSVTITAENGAKLTISPDKSYKYFSANGYPQTTFPWIITKYDKKLPEFTAPRMTTTTGGAQRSKRRAAKKHGGSDDSDSESNYLEDSDNDSFSGGDDLDLDDEVSGGAQRAKRRTKSKSKKSAKKRGRGDSESESSDSESSDDDDQQGIDERKEGGAQRAQRAQQAKQAKRGAKRVTKSKKRGGDHDDDSDSKAEVKMGGHHNAGYKETTTAKRCASITSLNAELQNTYVRNLIALADGSAQKFDNPFARFLVGFAKYLKTHDGGKNYCSYIHALRASPEASFYTIIEPYLPEHAMRIVSRDCIKGYFQTQWGMDYRDTTLNSQAYFALFNEVDTCRAADRLPKLSEIIAVALKYQASLRADAKKYCTPASLVSHYFEIYRRVESDNAIIDPISNTKVDGWFPKRLAQVYRARPGFKAAQDELSFILGPNFRMIIESARAIGASGKKTSYDASTEIHSLQTRVEEFFEDIECLYNDIDCPAQLHIVSAHAKDAGKEFFYSSVLAYLASGSLYSLPVVSGMNTIPDIKSLTDYRRDGEDAKKLMFINGLGLLAKLSAEQDV